MLVLFCIVLVVSKSHENSNESSTVSLSLNSLLIDFPILSDSLSPEPIGSYWRRKSWRSQVHCSFKKKREKKKGSVISHTQILGSYWEVKWKIFYFYLCFLSCHGSIKLWKQHRPLLHECLTETILIWIPCLCRRSKNNYCTSNFWSINYYHSNLKLLTFITFSHFISSLCTSKCC